jgi:chromosome segregation ATPase
MERRCREIETGNNHLLEEISKLSSEFNNTKEREESWRDESTKLKSRIAILEEENETLHQQVMGAQNAHQLTQVSMIATQANYDGIQVELERVTKEMQVRP